MPETSQDDERAGSQDGQRDPPADSTLILEGIRALHARLDELERKVARRERPGPDSGPVSGPVSGPGDKPHPMPAWKRVTEGEARWQATVAVAVAIVLQSLVPGRLTLVHPIWLLPTLEGLLLVALVVANPHRINR